VPGTSINCPKKTKEGVMYMFGQISNKIPTIKISTPNRLLCINIQSPYCRSHGLLYCKGLPNNCAEKL